jgi:hypothetical protein
MLLISTRLSSEHMLEQIFNPRPLSVCPLVMHPDSARDDYMDHPPLGDVNYSRICSNSYWAVLVTKRAEVKSNYSNY